MSGIWEVYLWRVTGKYIRNNSENCHIVGIDQIMMSHIELLKCCCQFGFLKPLAQQLCSEHFPTLHEVLIIWTGSGTMDYLWNVNAVCRRDITAQEWEVNNGKIEVIPFVVKPSKLSVVNVGITMQVWGGGCSLHCFLYFKFMWIDEFQILCKFCVFLRQYIIYISVGEIELMCEVFLACLQETLYKLGLIPASYEYNNKSPSNGAQLVSAISMPIVCWNIRPPNSTKILSIRYSSILEV